MVVVVSLSGMGIISEGWGTERIGFKKGLVVLLAAVAAAVVVAVRRL